MAKSEIKVVAGVETVRAKLLSDVGGIRYVFTTRRGASDLDHLDFDYRKEGEIDVAKSYERIASYFGVGTSNIYVPKQVHGSGVEILRDYPSRSRMLGRVENDACVTDFSGLVLTVLTADCLPILMVDPKRKVVAAVHAGWRSTVLGISRLAVEKMVDSFGSDPKDIVVALGPAIGPCCYEVGLDVISSVKKAFPFSERYLFDIREGHANLDLAGLNSHILAESGISEKNIWLSGLCTSCHPDLFYSYRRDGEGTGRMMNAIVLE